MGGVRQETRSLELPLGIDGGLQQAVYALHARLVEDDSDSETYIRSYPLPWAL